MREDEFAALIGKDVPAETNVTIERIRFVLREDANSLQLRVDAVGQSEVDDPIDSSKRNGGLCSMLRQRIKALALAAGEYDCQCVLQNRACSGSGSFQGSITPAAFAISFLSH